ncbi:MAG: hypothetical protein ABI867_32535 [Kofleriaceae bacterium]
MKTLDDQVPSGYFEGLPQQMLARLEDSSMQTTSESSGTQLPAAGVPPKDEREEDSGLHDIRSLASSQRMRLSSKRVSTTPPMDEDILASSSAGWKAVALPEPARMVSLPELADLPTKAEVKAAEKAAKASRKSRPSGQMTASSSSPELPMSASTSAPAMPAVSVVEAPLRLEESKPVVAPIAMIGSRMVPKKPAQKSNKGLLLGVAGLGIAAAAGVMIYVKTQSPAAETAKQADGQAAAVEGARNEVAPPPAPAAAKPEPTVQAIATDDPAKPDDAAAKGAGSAPASEPDPAPPVTKSSPKVKNVKESPPKKPGGKTVIEVPAPADSKKPITKVDKTEKPVAKDGEPDFNDLLKEAGVDQTKKTDKPKLDKTSLNGTDFKNGMNAVRAKAQACFNGTQGTANVKLTVAPSGQVSKVSVTGQFAGTPVAGCVESAVKSASFPAWDGGPQSFGYSYLLSE